jgi:hypothetical protein
MKQLGAGHKFKVQEFSLLDYPARIGIVMYIDAVWNFMYSCTKYGTYA